MTRTQISLVAAVPALLLLVSLVCIKTNVPVLDDYNTVLGFLSSWVNGEDRSTLFLTRHNEHLIYFTRLVVLADFYLFGQVNFVRLSVYAALGLVVIYTALRWIALREWEASTTVASILPALVVFMPEHWKYLLYPMANIAAIWVVSFGLWFIIFACSRRYLLAAIMGVAALATSSAALLLPAAVSAAMLVGKRYREAAVYGLSFPMCAAGYSWLSGEKPKLLENLLAHPSDSIKFGLGVLGSSASSLLHPNVILGVGVGVASLLAMIYVLYLAARSPAPKQVTIAVSLFAVGATMLIGMGRGTLYARNIVEMIADGRYRIYSVLAFGILLLVISKVRSPAAALTIAAMMITLSYGRNLPEWSKRSKDTRKVAKTYLQTRNPRVLPGGRKAPESLDAAIATGVYRGP